MTSTNARFTLCDIDLNGEITPLPYLNIDVEISLTNQPIFGLEERDEENLEETEESNNDTGTIFISLCLFTLSLISYSTSCLVSSLFINPNLS